MTADDRAAHRYALSRVAFCGFFFCLGVLATVLAQAVLR